MSVNVKELIQCNLAALFFPQINPIKTLLEIYFLVFEKHRDLCKSWLTKCAKSFYENTYGS